MPKAKAAGVYNGRTEDAARNAGIARMLATDASWTEIQAAFKCSRSTVARIKQRMAVPVLVDSRAAGRAPPKNGVAAGRHDASGR